MIDTARFSAAAAAEGFELTARQLEQFDQYAQFLVEYNEKVNLTAITDPEGIEVKHFLDSLMLLKAVELPEGASVIDVGTGAGFPSVPAKIVRDDLRLILVGSGPDAAELHERARVLGIGDKVFFAGSLTRDDLSLCFSVCKAFVSASDSITMEAAPIEAIASGLPVILRPASANAELIISGVNGFSYETPDELGDIVKKLAQLDADGELLMRKLVSKTAASLTDLNQAKALVSCYEMALGRHTQS